MTYSLDGPRAKVQRAGEHLATFEAESAPFRGDVREGDAYRIVSERDGTSVVRRLKLVRPVPVVRLGVLVGDVVHQCRSALDNLIEQATVAHTGHPLKWTAFPVFSDPLAYARRVEKGPNKGQPAPRSGLYAIRGVSPAIAAQVEKLQPFQYPADDPPRPLDVLHALWNMDKHRVPPIVGQAGFASQTRFVGGLTGPRTVEENIVFPFKDGADLMRYGLLEGETEADVKMEMDISVQLLFGEGPLDGYEVLNALRTCLQFTSMVIEQDFAPLLT